MSDCKYKIHIINDSLVCERCGKIFKKDEVV